MWFFGGKDKDKKNKKNEAKKAEPTKPMTTKEAKTQQVLAQMRELRAEIGEEQLQEIVRKIKLDDLKKQIKSDIDNNPYKRERLLDEIRFQVHDADRDPTKKH
ncbi:MAG: hypothetical protein EBQ96_08200 [Proteobacteria bacterium]|nr:hypothetical protein [Pseudomonadota bacterium]